MKPKLFALMFILNCIIMISACSGNHQELIKGSSERLKPGELAKVQDREQIGNQIPSWVMDADWDKPMYAISSPDIKKFDDYARENFPDYCDAGWTQEQSDAVYLGQGIELFVLGDETPEYRSIYYPVILNGVIVGGYEVYELLEDHELHMQAAPYFVNELNAMTDLTSADAPLILGYNNNNTIGIIGDTYYILDRDHMEHKSVDVNEIPVMEMNDYIVVNVKEAFCVDRTANVNDWHMYYDE